MLLSKIVLARKKNARAVLASIQTHAAKVARALDALCGEDRPTGDPAPDYLVMLEDLARLIERRAEALEAADWAHLDEEANDRRLRRERDEAISATLSVLI